MKTWLNPKIEVLPSPIEGKRLFANEPIAKGEQLTRNGDDDYIMTDEAFQAFIDTISHGRLSFGTDACPLYGQDRLGAARRVRKPCRLWITLETTTDQARSTAS